MADKAVDSNIRVRFPPSPTGPVHVGNIRTAIYNWLFARQNGGAFLFRIEDTDKERSKPEYETQIIEALNWLGLDWDEGFGKEQAGMSYRQSERTAIYRAYLTKLLEEGKAYWCYCAKDDLEAERQLLAAEGKPQIYPGHCRDLQELPEGKTPQVIRLKIPHTTIEFDDIIRGKVKTDTSLVGDFVIAKNLDEPLYHLAVVVDDADMEVTHVIRGEDHISNTPKQILIQHALGFRTPTYAHLPLILGSDRAKLSKRDADVSLLSYRERGYLPEAIINFLALLGWHSKDDREVFTLRELVDEFDLSRVQKGGAIWNEEKLQWLNKEHIKRLSVEELEERLRSRLPDWAKAASREMLHEVITAVRDRMQTLADFSDLALLFFELPSYDPQILAWKKGTIAEAEEVFKKLEEVMGKMESYRDGLLEQALQSLLEQYGKGNVLWPLRAALSGQSASPDPYTIAAVLGPEESLRRIKIARNLVSKLVA